MDLTLKFPEKVGFTCNNFELKKLMQEASKRAGFDYDFTYSMGILTGLGYGKLWSNIVLRKDKHWGDKRIAVASLHDGQFFDYNNGVSILLPNYFSVNRQNISPTLSSVASIEDSYARKFIAHFYEAWMGK
jgi:hypothetical protein